MISKKRDFIANYDNSEDYKYSDFWKNREYEHKAEIMLLKRLFNKYIYKESNKKQVFVDIGGSFGRLASFYTRRFKYAVIGDYSMRELSFAYKNYKKDKSMYFIGLNAYKLPFANNTIDYIMSVRLVHHLKYLEEYVKEISRVLKPGGTVILEVAHKNNIKAVLRSFLHGDFSYIKKNITAIKHDKKQSQGIKEEKGQIPIMYNFHRKFVYQLFKEHNITVKGIYSCSFLRLPILKKILPLRLMLILEKALQYIPFFYITPSLFFVGIKTGENNKLKDTGKLEDILVCPELKTKIDIKNNKILCGSKDLKYKLENIRFFDLRNPRPEVIKF